MAKSAPEAEPSAAAGPGGYFHWSRDPAVGLFAVLPLWLAYEALRFWLVPEERNGAELFLLHELQRLDARVHIVLSALFALLVLAAARSLVRRNVPWLRVVLVVALEGTMYALLLGPLASQMAASATRVLAMLPAADPRLLGNLVGSIGAGVFEELVFRLGLMSALVWIGLRALRAWAMPTWLAGVFGAIASGLVFSWFHHLCGEPFESRRFVFRTMAGILLGLLMWARGFGVCVYTHTMYNVYYYLGHDG
ncbi:MAG: CPBP family intramembrane metalloprotease [Planctomycetes bacterium]|nr:CPBP family intramembrane metalloprotease [Planctomycetota bacterium]